MKTISIETVDKDRCIELCDAFLDAIGDIQSAQDFADALAALNAATASLLAHHAPNETDGLANVTNTQAALLDLYRQNRNAMADGHSVIGRTN